jgi:hypothetical protein
MVLETASDPGSIRIVLPEEDTPRSMLRVYQDDLLLSGPGLAEWLRGHGTPILVRETRDFVIPRMAPGSYRLCYGEPEGETPCTSGYLAPGGSLELSLR